MSWAERGQISRKSSSESETTEHEVRVGAGAAFIMPLWNASPVAGDGGHAKAVAKLEGADLERFGQVFDWGDELFHGGDSVVCRKREVVLVSLCKSLCWCVCC
jgi:hypothetical protein